ncbi:hypothetical protein ACQ0P8_04205 [Halodesulfovibrio aestuarii]|uniref:Uncharacterized protein n=1 Tax=Halodesulfovibrio aestuarii TaxID=126333 RepID=A0A8G2F747_9BACT|nr:MULTISPECIES: hypothetical protein [Halodesulfovibrio]KAF1073587.1 hypothetical protein MKHDV_03505 [Halodesulfovibrio sp. MK-HDV]SHI75015.1 hypothetical protein SAMN05660830_00865 [Halodesulfovibrio aestuarii]
MQQIKLFQYATQDEQVAKLAGVMPQVRANMNSVMKERPNLSRDQLADELTEISRAAGILLSTRNAKCVSRAMLDKWLQPAAREHPPPILAVVAFCMATGDISPLLPILQAVGCEIMSEEDKKLRDYAQAVLSERDAKKRKKQLEAQL